MDQLSGLLEGPRARQAFLLRTVFSPPWSIRVEDRAPLSIVVVVAGHAELSMDGEPARHLAAGSVAILRGPTPYQLADDATRDPRIVIEPGQRCRTVQGRPLAQEMSLGVRTWGNDPDGGTVMIVGTYEQLSTVGDPLLARLPSNIVLGTDDWDCTVVDLLAAETSRDEPGQSALLDRLLDLVLVTALRAWLADGDDPAAVWYQAHADPVVGAALRLIHDRPAEPWTVARLARAAGVSRALLAQRFNELTGTPPMTYLTTVRLSLAADRLLEPGTTIAAVADEVGYSSAFALSTAFKRVRGVSPREHRRALLSN